MFIWISFSMFSRGHSLKKSILLDAVMSKTSGWVANSINPNQRLCSVASDLGLYGLLRPVCPIFWGLKMLNSKKRLLIQPLLVEVGPDHLYYSHTTKPTHNVKNNVAATLWRNGEGRRNDVITMFCFYW